MGKLVKVQVLSPAPSRYVAARFAQYGMRRLRVPFPMHAFVKLNASLDPHTLDKSVHEQKKARSFGVRAS
ncbi:hypothetical protein C1854_12630 [Eggerthella lenta]|nr:hypothetical protein C1854_12630 [Eggerthella lenta]